MNKFSKSKLGELIMGITFGRFSRLLPVKRVKETDKVIAFWHPKPLWERHILIVPKKAVLSLDSITENDLPYILDVYRVAREIILEKKWKSEDYSLIVNGGNRQKIPQLHFHLVRGKQLV